jgi:hypothetical protein
MHVFGNSSTVTSSCYLDAGSAAVDLGCKSVCVTDANNHKAYCLSNKQDYIPEPMQFGEFTFIMTHSPNELPLNIMLSRPCSMGSGCIAGGGCESAGSEVGATWSTLVTACLPGESSRV